MDALREAHHLRITRRAAVDARRLDAEGCAEALALGLNLRGERLGFG